MSIAAEHTALLAPGMAAPRRWTIPDLWRAAQGFIASMFAAHGDAAALVRRAPLSGQERRAILGWLIPAERLVRQLLMANAITFLLMTEAGRAIRRRAKPITLPRPPEPYRPFGTTRMVIIPLNANLARHYVPEKPRIEKPPVDPDNPETWRTPFRILHRDWTNQGRKPPKRPLCVAVRAASNLPLARRIEALRRTLVSQRARMMHLARYLARLPKHFLGAGSPGVYFRNKPLPALRDERIAAWEFVEAAIDHLDSS